jgi:hypothetical protein
MLFYKFSIIVKIRKKKSCQKIVKNCQKTKKVKIVKQNVKKLSKSCQKLS